MVKSEPNTVSSSKHSPIFFKLLAPFLFLGLAFPLFYSHPFYHPPPLAAVDRSPSPSKTPAAEEKCDLFDGEWVRKASPPAYTDRSCGVMESHQNCMRNGRPDSEYLKWRWSPRRCELREFDGGRFVHVMRNKWWAFMGDSISRNHAQSLVCILSQVEQAVETYHDEAYRSKRWIFPTYNLTISVIWTPYLIQADVFEDDNGVSFAETQLHLDKIDHTWTSQYNSFDYVILAGGKWFLKTAIYYENNTITGCHNCPGERNITDLGIDYAYRKTLQLVFNFITSSTHKPFVIFRTITPDHFENGEWNTGGTCVRREPLKEDEAEMADVDRLQREIEKDEFQKASGNGSVTMKLLDTTYLSLLRPDGHPGPYRHFQPFASNKDAKVQNDCLHWCLPGPIDSWNDLLVEIVVNGSKS